MQIFKKLLLFSILALGLPFQQLSAHEKIDDAIFAVVIKALDGKKIDKKSLVLILKHLKVEIMILIKDQPEAEYQKLYQDLQRLSFDNIVSEYWQIMEAISLLPEKSKIYIEEKINAQIKAMPYWRKKALCFLLKIDLPKQHSNKNG